MYVKVNTADEKLAKAQDAFRWTALAAAPWPAWGEPKSSLGRCQCSLAEGFCLFLSLHLSFLIDEDKSRWRYKCEKVLLCYSKIYTPFLKNQLHWWKAPWEIYQSPAKSKPESMTIRNRFYINTSLQKKITQHNFVPFFSTQVSTAPKPRPHPTTAKAMQARLQRGLHFCSQEREQIHFSPTVTHKAVGWPVSNRLLPCVCPHVAQWSVLPCFN